jgi:hypothetical protein
MIAHGPENVFYVAAVIFAAVALLHLTRIYMGWPVMIGGWSVPMWVSWIGLVVAGGLAFFGLRLAAHDAWRNE